MIQDSAGEAEQKYLQRLYLRRVAAEAAFDAFLFSDENIEQAASNEAALFWGLSACRGALTALVSSHFVDQVSADVLEDAIQFLPSSEVDVCLTILQAALEAQTSPSPAVELQRIVECFDEFALHLGDKFGRILLSSLNGGQQIDLETDGYSFQQSEIEATPYWGFWFELEELSGFSGTWSFWKEWHASFFGAQPVDWILQLRVSQISEEIWQQGPEAVAAEIERIKAEMLSERLPMAETIELNPETGRFRAVPAPVENAQLMSALLGQIEDAMEDCIGSHNGLAQHSGDVKKLDRVLTKYRDDPQNAELTLTRVATSLRVQLHDSRELPDNEDNLALLNAVEEGVRGIRANHPEVAANRAQLAQQAFKALSAEEKQLLEDALPMLEEISEPELAEDFAQDIPELVNDALRPVPVGAPPLPGADAATRVFSRVSKMALMKDQLANLAKAGAMTFDSDIAKSVRLVGMAVGVTSGVGGVLYALVQVGLRILGVL